MDRSLTGMDYQTTQMTNSTHAVITMMAKEPIPGNVKTRMSPELSAKQCAKLATAFMLDTWLALGKVECRRSIAWAGSLENVPTALGESDIFLQSGSGLGMRIEHVLAHGLKDCSASLAVGSDIPGVPPGHLERVIELLDNHDIVLGPSGDGGFYAIGATRLAPNMLGELPWSSRDTLAETIKRLKELHFTVGLAPAYDDFDCFDDLKRISLASAPATYQVLQTMNL